MEVLISIIIIVAIITVFSVIFISIWNKLYENDIVEKIPNFILEIYNSVSFTDAIVTILLVCFILFIIFTGLYNTSRNQIAQYTEDEYDIEQIVSDYKKKNQLDPEKYEIEIKFNDQYKPVATLYEYYFKKDHYLLEVYNVNINIDNIEKDMDYSKYKRKEE